MKQERIWLSGRLNPKLRKATEKDFKVGATIIDSGGNEFTLKRKYDDGIWECNHRVHFEDEAKFYFIKWINLH